MGRSRLVAKYDITPEIKELQHLAKELSGAGHHINVDITQDQVTFNGFRKMTRAEAKEEMLRMMDKTNKPLTTSDFPDQELLAKQAKAKAKAEKKHREPGAPPELKALIRRAKRIYKKAVAKGMESQKASEKAQSYITRKGTDENKAIAHQAFIDHLQKATA